MVNILDSEDEKKGEETRRLAAVALRKYGIDEAAVPRIVAAGYGKLAEQILEIAFRNGVKVREDKDLAHVLTALDQGSPIPPEALVAVAEILAYVYKVNRTYQAVTQEEPRAPDTSG